MKLVDEYADLEYVKGVVEKVGPELAEDFLEDGIIFYRLGREAGTKKGFIGGYLTLGCSIVLTIVGRELYKTYKKRKKK